MNQDKLNRPPRRKIDWVSTDTPNSAGQKSFALATRASSPQNGVQMRWAKRLVGGNRLGFKRKLHVCIYFDEYDTYKTKKDDSYLYKSPFSEQQFVCSGVTAFCSSSQAHTSIKVPKSNYVLLNNIKSPYIFF